MKKLILSTCLLLSGITLFAQTPPNKNLGIINKTTATWCGPCGSWGWTLFEDIIADNHANAICMGTYGDNASDLYNQTADDFKMDFAPTAGWPAFCAVGLNRTEYAAGGGIYPSITRTNVKTSIDSFINTPVLASTGYTYTINGNSININTTTKFWAANNGDFYVNVYFVEDGVMNVQNGQTGTVAHHDVLRGGITGTWGQNLINGAITANQTFNKSFSYTIPAGWDKSKLKVVTMIWKKNGSDYMFINANNVANAPAGINNIEEAGNIRLFPNPATNFATLSIDVDQVTNIQYTITDINGKTVLSKSIPHVAYGNYKEAINTESFHQGTYLLKVAVGDHVYAGKLAIIK
jgi:hypothetical protein